MSNDAPESCAINLVPLVWGSALLFWAAVGAAVWYLL